MSQDLALGVFLFMVLVAANLPWFSEKILFVFASPSGDKLAIIRLLELVVLYGFTLLTGFALESRVTGSQQPQDWEFYAITVCLFLVFSVPGFIWRYILRR